MALPKKLKYFNVHNQGESYIGQTKQITTPKLALKVEAYRSGGMLGEVDVDLGLEKLECEQTYGGLMEGILKDFGLVGVDQVLLRFSGSYQREDTGAVDAVEIVMRGKHVEIEPGDAEGGKDTEFKVKSTLSYYKMSINGVVMIEIDMLNMIFIVDGVDRVAQHRAAIE